MTDKTLTEEQIQIWAKEQFQRAIKFVAEKGVVYDSIIAEDCRYLAPFVAVWKVKALDKNVYWVISGDLPLDVTYFDSAPTAREAMRFFSMQWQLKAENLERNNADNDSSQADYIELLRTKAEELYVLQNDDTLWGSAPAKG